MITEENFKDLTFLEDAGVITTADKNLRSKIESIDRNLEQLLQKKLRIEFEIKRQKKSLVRKREELKKVTSRNNAKLKLTLESGNLVPDPCEEHYTWLRQFDSKLLQESSQRLDT